MGLFNDKQTTEQTPATVGPKGDPGIGFKMTNHGNYDMDNKILFNVKTQDDVHDGSDYNTIKKDYESAVNKEYLKNNFLKRDSKTQTFFDLKGYSIQNSEVYDPNSWNDKTITNKQYVDMKDNLKADKTELNKKADLETSDEQTFKGIINVPHFDPGYSNMTNVMNKRYIDQKVDKTVIAPQRLLSRLMIPNYKSSDHSIYDTVNINFLNNNFLSRKSGGLVENFITFNKNSPNYKRQLLGLGIPSENDAAVNKTYVDTELQKISDLTGVLKADGSVSMDSDLNMGNNSINNVKEPNNDSDVVNKKYLEDHVGESHVQSVNSENKFKYIMNDPGAQLSEEDDVELGNIATYQNSPHQINKNVVDMKLLLDSSKGYYSSRVGLNLYPLSDDEYTVCIEIMWVNDDIDPNSLQIDGSSAIETIHTVYKKTFKTQKYTRMLCQFTKSQQLGNNYLYIDIVMKMKSGSSYDQKLQTYLTVYGTYGHQSNLNPSMYDQIYYVTNNQIIFNAPINMNTQVINSVQEGITDDQAVNLKQLKNYYDSLRITLETKITELETKMNTSIKKSYYAEIFEYFFDLLDPSNFIMSDSLGAVVSGLGSNLVFQTTKLLKEFKPRDGFTGVFIVDLNENVTENDNWTIYIAFKYDYKSGDNKRIKIELGNDGSFDFPWVKLESGKLFLDYDLDVYSKQIRDAYIGEYLNLWYTKIAGQFRIAVCNNAMSINQTFSGFNINAANIKITSDYFVQRIGFSMTAFPINNKEYHKIQFLDKTKSVFFE